MGSNKGSLALLFYCMAKRSCPLYIASCYIKLDMPSETPSFRNQGWIFLLFNLIKDQNFVKLKLISILPPRFFAFFAVLVGLGGGGYGNFFSFSVSSSMI